MHVCRCASREQTWTPYLCAPAALSMKYFFDQLHFESGGALAALTLGLTVKEMWRRQWPKLLARQVPPAQPLHPLLHTLQLLW